MATQMGATAIPAWLGTLREQLAQQSGLQQLESTREWAAGDGLVPGASGEQAGEGGRSERAFGLGGGAGDHRSTVEAAMTSRLMLGATNRGGRPW